MKEQNLKVAIVKPKADQVVKLKNKSLISYINIGKPVQSDKFGYLPRIQLNDCFAEPGEI